MLRRKAPGQGPWEAGGGDAGRSVSSVIATAGDMVTTEDASYSQVSVLIKKNVSGNDSDCSAWVGQGRSRPESPAHPRPSQLQLGCRIVWSDVVSSGDPPPNSIEPVHTLCGPRH